MLERGTPGVSYNLISKIGHRLTPNAEIIVRQRPRPGRQPRRGHARQRRPPDQPQLRLVGPRRGDRGGRRRPRRVRGGARLGEDLHGGRPEADHPLPERRLRARRRRRADRDVPLLLLEDRPLPGPARLPRRADRRDVQGPLHRAAVRRRLQVHAGGGRQQRRPEAHVREVPARGDDPAALRRRQLRHAAPARARRARHPDSTRGRSWTTSASSSPRRWRRSTRSRRTRSSAPVSDRR